MSQVPCVWISPNASSNGIIAFEHSRSDYPRFCSVFQMIYNKKFSPLILSAQASEYLNKVPSTSTSVPSKPKDPLQKRIINDILRTIGRHRSSFGLESQSTDDPVIAEFYRIVTFSSYSFPYKQGFCDIIVPLFHIFFQGLTSSPCSIKESSVIEASVAFAFVHMMSKPPISHLGYFPPKREMDTQLSMMKEELRPSKAAAILSSEETVARSFIMRWLLLLFSQDLFLPELCSLWEFLFSSGNGEKFDERLRRICVCIIKSIENEKSEASESELLAELQSTKLPPVEAIIAMCTSS